MTGAMILAVLFTVALVPLFVFRTEPVTRTLEVVTPKERMSWRMAVAALTLHMTLCCVLIAHVTNLGLVRTTAGGIMFATGMSFWLWGRRAIGPLRKRRTPDQPPLRFRDDGPFGLVRNPLYFGLVLACAGLGLAANHPIVWVTFAACLYVLDLRARHEEERMLAQVGSSYAAYQREVKRLIPFVW
jgi:protein-S-isoprenylcysteine O-methyltransferase Ste14